MSKNIISIRDFDLFCEVMKSAVKVVDSAKLTITKDGLEIYGARQPNIARCEIVSNAIYSDDKVEFAIEKVAMFNRILSTIQEIHSGDYSEFKFIFDQPFVRFESKKFKTRFSTCNEATISQWISKKIEAEMHSVFEFSTTPDLIKRVNGHSFMFTDSKNVRVFITTNDTMEKNAVFATLGAAESNLSNEVTLKFGAVTDGKIPDDRKIIIDLERMNLFTAANVQEMRISLMNYNMLMSKTKTTGKNDSFSTFTIYNSVLKN